MDTQGQQPDFKFKVETYVYKVNITVIHLKDEKKNQDLTNYISDIGLFFKYIDFNMPVAKIILTTNRAIATLLKEEYLNMVFNLTLSISKEEKDSTNPMVSNSAIYTPIFTSQKLVIINEPISAPAPKTTQLNGNYKDSLLNSTVSFELFPSNAIENQKELVNDSFGGCSVVDAMASILGEKIHNKVFMQTPHNTKKFSSMFIPPLGLNKAFAFIQDKYSIYNNGLLFFHDFGEKTWITDRFDRFEGVPKQENTVIFEIYSTQSASHTTNGCYYNKDTKQWHVRTQTEPLVMDLSSQNAILEGEEFVIQGTSPEEYSYSQKVVSKNSAKAKETGKVTKRTTIANSSSAKSSATNVVNSLDSSSRYVSFTISKINPLIFSPIKAYKLAYFNGNKADTRTYVLSDVTMLFTKIGHERDIFNGHFELILNLEL